MGLAIAGLIVNWFGTLIIALNGEFNDLYRTFTPVALIFATISTIGIFLAGSNKKLSGTLIIIGSIFFIPLGLIGVFGGKKIADQGVDKSLDERRNI